MHNKDLVDVVNLGIGPQEIEGYYSDRLGYQTHLFHIDVSTYVVTRFENNPNVITALNAAFNLVASPGVAQHVALLRYGKHHYLYEHIPVKEAVSIKTCVEQVGEEISQNAYHIGSRLLRNALNCMEHGKDVYYMSPMTVYVCPTTLEPYITWSGLDNVFIEGQRYAEWKHPSLAYVCPELFSIGQYVGEKSAVYLVGMLLWTMRMKTVQNTRRFPLADLSENDKNAMSQMLQPNLNMRIDGHSAIALLESLEKHSANVVPQHNFGFNERQRQKERNAQLERKRLEENRMRLEEERVRAAKLEIEQRKQQKSKNIEARRARELPRLEQENIMELRIEPEYIKDHFRYKDEPFVHNANDCVYIVHKFELPKNEVVRELQKIINIQKQYAPVKGASEYVALVGHQGDYYLYEKIHARGGNFLNKCIDIITENDAVRITIDILNTMETLRSGGIARFLTNPYNLWIDENKNAHITMHGMNDVLDEISRTKSQSEMGYATHGKNIAYTPPELFSTGDYKENSHIYIAGVLLWTMLTKNVVKVRRFPPAGIPEEYRPVFKKMVDGDILKRCTVRDAITSLNAFIR